MPKVALSTGDHLGAFRVHLRHLAATAAALQAGRVITHAEIAAAIGVSRRTVVRYVEFLREIGAQVEEHKANPRGSRIVGKFDFGRALAAFAERE